jgi:hypothetical protein
MRMHEWIKENILKKQAKQPFIPLYESVKFLPVKAFGKKHYEERIIFYAAFGGTKPRRKLVHEFKFNRPLNDVYDFVEFWQTGFSYKTHLNVDESYGWDWGFRYAI